MVLFIWNVTLFKILPFFDNTQYFVHNKSSSNSQSIKDKLRDFQKLLKHLNGIATSVFKSGTGGCSCCDPSRFGGDCASRGGLTSVFPRILCHT